MFPPQQIAALSQFIKILDQQPDLLHNDQLAFFRDYLTKLGATIPPAPKAEETSKTEEPKPAEKPVEPEPEEEMEEEEEEEPAEPDADLWTPDDDVPPITIDGASEVSEESMDKAMELKSEAMGLQSEGDFEGAVGKMTEALKLNPSIAMLYANRGHCYMKLKKPKAAIADCTAAISLNPNSAKAFKVRGKCYRHLGNYELAANDLRMGQQIDFDEDTAELHKLVEDKAKKIFEKKRCKERNARARAEKDKEAALRQRQEELKKQREREEEEERAEAAAAGMGGMGGMPGMGGMGGMPGMGGMGGMPGMGGMGGMPGMGGMGGMPGMGGMGGMPGMGGKGAGGKGGMPGMGDLPPGFMEKILSDPEVAMAMQDPEVQALLPKLMSGDPSAIAAAQSNPKLAKLLGKFSSMFGGAAGGAAPSGSAGPGAGFPGPGHMPGAGTDVD